LIIDYIPTITDNLELVDLIIKNAIDSSEYEPTLNMIFNSMTSKGYIQGLEHLLNNYHINQNILNDAAIDVAHYGDVKTLNWLLNNGATNITQIMQEAINSKAKNVIEFLSNKFLENVDLYDMVIRD
jgi:hypothetical protein